MERGREGDMRVRARELLFFLPGVFLFFRLFFVFVCFILSPFVFVWWRSQSLRSCVLAWFAGPRRWTGGPYIPNLDVRSLDVRNGDVRNRDVRNVDVRSGDVRNVDVRYVDGRSGDARNGDVRSRRS